MTLSITHTTPADGTFSTTGAAAWNATHSLGGVADISQGGTNATTAADARTSLGLGTIAIQAANSVAITGGAIDGTTIGATTVAAGSFSTLNSSGATRLGGLSGNQSLQVNNVASAVNYAQIVGAVTGGAPTFSALGTDTDVGLNVTSKGFGVVSVNTGTGTVAQFQDRGTATINSPFIFRAGTAGSAAGTLTLPVAISIQIPDNQYSFKTNSGISGASSGLTQFVILSTASAVNYVQATGAATGAAPTISAQGSDTHIGLDLTAKGVNGAINLKVNGSLTLIAGQSGSGAGNHVVLYPTSNTFNWVLRGTDTNVGFILTTKGTGNFFFNTGGGTQAFISDATSAVNYLSFVGAATGVGPSIGVAGSDANINLKLTPKGTGVLQFGTYTAGIVAQAGFITITDAGGTSRRLLVG